MKLFVKILLLTLYIALFAGAVILMAFARNSHTQKKYSGLEVKVHYPDNDKLIDANDIKTMITAKYGKVENLLIGELGQPEVLRLLRTNPYLSNIVIKTTVEGKYEVTVRQVNPKVRLIDNTGRQCFVDEEFNAVPVSNRYIIELPLITGTPYIPLNARGNLKDIASKNPEMQPVGSTIGAIHIAAAICKDSVMNALIEQIDINPSGSVNLYTKFNNLNIVFGDSTNTNEKLSNLKAFFESSVKSNSLTQYYKVNLQYKNQVVCSK